MRPVTISLTSSFSTNISPGDRGRIDRGSVRDATDVPDAKDGHVIALVRAGVKIGPADGHLLPLLRVGVGWASRS
jgi:hypothetical protein